MNYQSFCKKEKRFYEKIGVRKLKEFLLKLFLPKFGPREENNYHLKKGNGIQDLKDQKKFLYLNAFYHLGGYVALVLLCSLSIPVLVGVGVIQAYLIMVQRYNYIRLDEAIHKYQDYEQEKIQNLKIHILDQDQQLKLHRVRLYRYDLWQEVTISESLSDILDQASYFELLYYRKLFNQLASDNLQGIYYSEEYDIPALDGYRSEKTLSLIYQDSDFYHPKN